jgi:hypothetical protein
VIDEVTFGLQGGAANYVFSASPFEKHYIDRLLPWQAQK